VNEIEREVAFWQRYGGGYRHARQYGKTAILDDMKAALAKIEETKRTLLVHPSISPRLAEQIKEAGLQHLVRVHASPHVEEGKGYLFSDHGDLKESTDG
jgi:hypothetical protein